MIVVDASVAVKWVAKEPLHLQALELTHGLETLIAPDFVVMKTLNVLRRKLKRQEITDDQLLSAADELPLAFDLLVSNSSLARQTVALATELDHSVYDCAYLACALQQNAVLVTADRHFVRKLNSSRYGDNVAELGTSKADALTTQVALSSTEERASQLWQVFDQTVSHVSGQVGTPFGMSGMRLTRPGDLQPAFESPAYLRLKRFLFDLHPAELSRLLAFAWYGRAHVKESWEEVLASAETHVALEDARLTEYVISTLHTLRAGLEKRQSVGEQNI